MVLPFDSIFMRIDSHSLGKPFPTLVSFVANPSKQKKVEQNITINKIFFLNLFIVNLYISTIKQIIISKYLIS